MVKKILLIIGAVVLGMVTLCAISFFTDKHRYGSWSIEKNRQVNDPMNWIPFYWVSDSFNHRYFEKTAMFVPATIDDLPFRFSFQFDLGSDLTMIYGRNAEAIGAASPAWQKKSGRLKSPLQFWNHNRSIKNITIHFGPVAATSPDCLLKKNFGSTIDITDPESPDPIGTIGADLFRNKCLLIDYPHERFAILDKVPDSLVAFMKPVSLDKAGRVLLPILLNGKEHRVLFDNGSSLFPLLVTDDKINLFSPGDVVDSITIQSWGTMHTVVGRTLKDSFSLAGQSLKGQRVYVDYRKEARTDQFDGIAGNALFWEKLVIIDFAGKRFGVR